MTRKQPDVDRVTKTYKRKNIEPTHAPFIEKPRGGSSMFPTHYASLIPSCLLQMGPHKVPSQELCFDSPGHIDSGSQSLILKLF